MGKYVNIIGEIALGASYRDKCNGLIEAGAKKVSGDYFEENLICVADAGFHASAAYIYDEDEYEEFAREDGRPKTWFVLKDAHIHAN